MTEGIKLLLVIALSLWIGSTLGEAIGLFKVYIIDEIDWSVSTTLDDLFTRDNLFAVSTAIPLTYIFIQKIPVWGVFKSALSIAPAALPIALIYKIVDLKYGKNEIEGDTDE